MIDISKISFEEAVDAPIYQTTTLYFTAPKELLHGQYPEATSAEIALEIPWQDKALDSVTARISPTREVEGGTEDYDWSDFDIDEAGLVELLKLANCWAHGEIVCGQKPPSGPTMVTPC